MAAASSRSLLGTSRARKNRRIRNNAASRIRTQREPHPRRYRGLRGHKARAAGGTHHIRHRHRAERRKLALLSGSDVHKKHQRNNILLGLSYNSSSIQTTKKYHSILHFYSPPPNIRLLRSDSISPLYLKKSGPLYCFQLIPKCSFIIFLVNSDNE